MAIHLNIQDETSALEMVILGIAEDVSGPAATEPKSRFHMELSSYPTQDVILSEMGEFQRILIEHGVKVLRPQNIKNQFQLFTRDLGFVVGDEFFVGSLVEARKIEKDGIAYIVDLFDPEKVIDTALEPTVKLEGGDVVLWKNTVFVGLSGRTNQQGFEFLKKRLWGKREVKQLEIVVDSADHRNHVLHLDCSFQPLGNDFAVVYEEGIKNVEELYAVLDLPESNIFKVDKGQFVRMFPNIFSISKNTVVIEKEFIELKYWLLDRGFKVIETRFREISKLSGLLRCATLPLVRKS